MALLHLLADRDPAGLVALTVDHGLRPEAASEAAWVGGVCAGLGIAHRTLEWRGWDRAGNLQAAAREARYRLLAGYCRENGIADAALGHTRDDNIETFFLGLMRGAGLEGLSGMRGRFERLGVTFHRPLLGIGRDALREVLKARGAGWIDDPSNEDTAFDRVRVRQALAGLGIESGRIAASIGNLAATDRDLGVELLARLRPAVRLDRGDLLIARDTFAAMTPEFRRRTLSAALRFIAGSPYPPRGSDVMRLVERDWNKGAATLHGCLIHPHRDSLRIWREHAAVADLECGPSGLWDNRWRFEGTCVPGTRIRALGPLGLAQLGPRRTGGRPRAADLASPSLWLGDGLLAAPLAGLPAPANLRLTRADDLAGFHCLILSH